MKWLKQIGLYAVLAVTLGLLLWMAFPTFWEDCILSASTGKQTVRYVQTAVSEEGEVYAAGRQGDVWWLVKGGSQGRDIRLNLKKLGITDVQSVNQIHACAHGGAVLVVYEQKEDLLCRVYYISSDGKTAQSIFSAPCRSGSMEDVRLYGFAEEGGAVAFLLEQEGKLANYKFIPETDSAHKLSDLTAKQAEMALCALPDGTFVLTDRGRLTMKSGSVTIPKQIAVLDGWATGDSAVLLDGTEGSLWHLDVDGERSQQLLVLENGVLDVSVSADQRIVLLDDGGNLQVWRDGVIQDYTGILYRPQWQSVLFLALGVLGVLLAALTLWYVLWEMRKMELSFVVRYGVVLAAVLALLTASAVRWMVQPHYEEQAVTAAQSYLTTAALAAPEPVVNPLGADWDYDETLTTRAEYVYALWRAFGSPQTAQKSTFEDVPADSPYAMAVEWALTYHITDGVGEGLFGPDQVLTDEQAFTFLYRAMRYIGGDRMTLAKEKEALYRVEADGGKTILSALLLGESYRMAAETALETGMAFVRYTEDGADYYAILSRAGEDRLTVLATPAGPYLQAARQGAADTARLLWFMAGAALILVLVALGTLSHSLQKVTLGMAAIQNGAHVEVVHGSGDEVSAMADSLNTMARTLREADAQEVRRGELYARFLPNHITDLLEVPSLEAINKNTFASRTMTTMHVTFTFDQQIYERRSKELFDNINEVTECAAKIVSAQGGVILSFAHNGFDALFEPDTDVPVRAAVAIRQEIISINRERSRRELSPVTLHITLDSDKVMLGVVGDEQRMQATALSSSFSTARVLDALFTRFEANILCTERIERWTEGYGSRYIGKTHNGPDLIRVYEIYDGDPYSVRQGKAESEKLFSEGVYTLYAGDYAAAKRIFMEIVRRNSGDGAAKHYLYLADRFEKEPPEEVCLDC